MKRQYKVNVMRGMDYVTTSFWDALRMQLMTWGVDILLILLHLLTRGSFWIVVAIIAAAFILRGC